MKFDHKVHVDFNLVTQLKEVREYWNQDTAIAKRKRKEFIDNAMKVGGTVLVLYLLGYVKGVKQGAKYGNTHITLISKGE